MRHFTRILLMILLGSAFFIVGSLVVLRPLESIAGPQIENPLPVVEPDILQHDPPLSVTYELYDGSQNTRLDQQGWVFYATSLNVTHTISQGTTLFDTTAVQNDFAGYMAFINNGNFAHIPSLKRELGFTLSITLRVLTETHTTDKDGDGIDDRAGFSIILLAEDKKGIEIAFWPDEIWAQQDGAAEPPNGTLFTHGEGVNFDTMAGLVNYQLSIISDVYQLTVDDNLILAGPVRDYYGFERNPDFYETPNLIFLGDDTSQAQAQVSIAEVSLIVVTPPALPQNQPPDPPELLAPSDSTTVNTLTQKLAWIGGDPDAQAVTYTLAFGTENPPPIITSTAIPIFTPTLEFNQTYYWQVTASDGISSTSGPLWTFNTIAPSIPEPKNHKVYLPLLRQP